jgi:hypothetical protein
VKRGLYLTLGVILLVVGIALAALGTVVALSVGSDDALSTEAARVRGTGVAVVAEDFRVDTSSLPVPDGVGTLTLTVTARDGRAMFVGSAATKDVDTYLTGAPYDVVVDLSAGAKATTRKVPGGQQPQPPGSQAFWAAQSSGAPASLSAHVIPGQSLVVMNADAVPVIDADLVVTLSVPGTWRYAWVAVAIGVLLVLVAFLAFWRAVVAGRRRKEAALAGPVAGPDAAPGLAPTILPGVATDALPPSPPVATTSNVMVLTPPEPEVLVASPSVGLAALVAEAGRGATDDPTIAMPPVLDEPASAPHPPTSSETPAVLEAEAPADTSVAPSAPDADADPLFAELVSAHGADPVHDALPEAGTGSAPPAAESAGPEPSGPPTTDG